jgi:hypothetical protein
MFDPQSDSNNFRTAIKSSMFGSAMPDLDIHALTHFRNGHIDHPDCLSRCIRLVMVGSIEHRASPRWSQSPNQVLGGD